MNQRLVRFAENYKIINECQARFRKDHLTAGHTFFTLNFLIKVFNSHKQKPFVGFIDCTCCFDFNPSTELFQKCLNKEIKGDFFLVIHNMYASIKSCVKLNNGVSSFFSCGRGVWQCDCLSTLPFSFYLNELANILIDIFDTDKYFGVVFSSNGSFYKARKIYRRTSYQSTKQCIYYLNV